MATHDLKTIHPGRILLEDFLAPRGISVFRLAKEIGVSPRRIYEIVQGQQPVGAGLALRLAHYFGLSKRFWLDLQSRYDRDQEKLRSLRRRKRGADALCLLTRAI